MTTKIARLSLKELWNSEYTLFVNQLVTIFLKYLKTNYFNTEK